MKVGKSFGQAIAALAIFGGIYSAIITYINHTPKERYADVIERQKNKPPENTERTYVKPKKGIKFA